MNGRGWSRGRRLGLVSLLAVAAASFLVAVTRQDSPASRDNSTSPPASVSPAAVGHAAGSQPRTRRPRAVRLPSGVSMAVDEVATGKDGVLDLPSDIYRAGWWDGGSRLGDPYGVIVLAAHVDSVTKGVGPFAELLGTRPGQRIRVAGTGLAQTFRIASVHLEPRASLSEDTALFSVHGPLRLVLITCGGPFDAGGGGYRDNLVVLADPVGRPRASRG